MRGKDMENRMLEKEKALRIRTKLKEPETLAYNLEANYTAPTPTVIRTLN
jgi:hypothetical protein